jgi:hypothetical protein
MNPNTSPMRGLWRVDARYVDRSVEYKAFAVSAYQAVIIVDDVLKRVKPFEAYALSVSCIIEQTSHALDYFFQLPIAEYTTYHDPNIQAKHVLRLSATRITHICHSLRAGIGIFEAFDQYCQPHDDASHKTLLKEFAQSINLVFIDSLAVKTDDPLPIVASVNPADIVTARQEFLAACGLKTINEQTVFPDALIHRPDPTNCTTPIGSITL